MIQILKILLVTIFILNSTILLGQENNKYELEEIEVINQLLYKVVDAERLSKFIPSDSSLVLYFHTGLDCNLDNRFKGEYKRNRLLKKLENNNLSRRFIDSNKIVKFRRLKIIFGRKNMYPIEKYDSNKIIGTINFSRISFNASLNKGYFYYEVYCGEDCGGKELLKIKKKNGVWKITDYLSISIY
jgi:hypothetical protein